MQVIEYAKEHPWTIAGIVAAGLVLYLVVSAGSDGSASAPAAVQQDASLQIAQLQLQGHAQDVNAQVQIAQLNAGTALSIETLKAQSGEYATQVGGTVQLEGIKAQRDIGLLTVTSQQLIAQAAQETQRQQIAATEDIALANAATYAHLADVNAQTVQASYAANVATQQILTGGAVNVAKAQANVAKSASSNQLWGNLANIAGNILSRIL